MSTDEKIIKNKVGLLKLAQMLGSVPEACKAAQEHLILTEEQLRALERAREEKEAHGEIETLHPGYLGTQERFHRTIQEEFYTNAFRKKLYTSLEEL
jgi:hypothetical protein